MKFPKAKCQTVFDAAQAVYRGHLSRRGVNPLINVIISNHGMTFSRSPQLPRRVTSLPGTTVFQHRAEMWPSGGQIYYAWAAFGWSRLMLVAALSVRQFIFVTNC